jgi:hypothetical protein
MNLQGANVDYPVHINYGQPMVAPPLHREDPTEPEEVPIGEPGSHSIPENTSVSSGTAARHPSILRKGMNTAAARARGASTSRKHVDFSLGMANLSSNDVMGDVFEDRSVRIDDVVRTSNREATERRMQDLAEEEEERRTSRSASASTGAASSHRGSRRPSNLTTTTTHEGRLSTDAHSVRSGASSARNRFFRHRSSVSRDGNDLESGRGVSPSAPVPVSSGAQDGHHPHVQVYDHDEKHMQ